MAQPTPQDVHIDAALSSISIAYKNDKYIADLIFPLIESDKESDYYYVWAKEFWFRNHVERRGPGSGYAEGGMTVAGTQFVCINQGLGFPLPVETLQNQDAAIDLEAAGAEWLADQFALNREILLAAAIFAVSKWTTDITLSGVTQWSDYANSNPIGAVDTGRQAIKKLTGIKPNRLVLGSEVYDILKSHPDLLDRFKYTSQAILNENDLAKLFDVEQVVVGEAVQTTVQEADTFSGAFIWGKKALLMYVPKTPGKMVAAAGYTFVHTPGGFAVQVRRVPDPLKNRDVLLGDQSLVHKITGADLGYFFETAVA